MIDSARLMLACIRDNRTPIYIKCIVFLTVAYVVSPIDLIPDFIPVIGLLDEVLLIPVIYKLVIYMMPQDVLIDIQSRQLPDAPADKIFSVAGLILVCLAWAMISVLLLIFAGLFFPDAIKTFISFFPVGIAPQYFIS